MIDYVSRIVSATLHYAFRLLCWVSRVASMPLVALALFAAAAISRAVTRDAEPPSRKRLVWGPAPIINNVYWSRAMSDGGWTSETYTESYAAAINQREDYDLLVEEELRWIRVRHLRLVAAFVQSLFKYDIIVTSFNGYFLGQTEFWRLESILLRIAGKRIVIIPFGGDAYVYRRIRSSTLAHGLMSWIPEASRRQHRISTKVDYWCDNADIVVPSIMGPDGIGRWDLLIPNPLCIDTDMWRPSLRTSKSDGRESTVVVAHSPNARGFKGSEFLVDSVTALQNEGLKVELRVLERVQNDEVRRVLAEETDILVEQLIATGHGLNGIEGMASGLPVICNLEDKTYVEALMRWSFLSECPLVSATPETLTAVLRELVTNPARRRRLGAAGREYTETYHSSTAFRKWFELVVEKLYNPDVDLQNLYSPLERES